MSIASPETEARTRIAGHVRTLRKQRGWTQAELAGRLRLSQGRLSQIERGGGSFSAEQFLQLLKLFNVTADYFEPTSPTSDAALQNTLARLGASHLRESDDVLPSQRLRAVQDVVREVLVSEQSSRLVTALAPVLVRNIEVVNLPRLHLQLGDVGLEHRLAWLVDNTLEAIRGELPSAPHAVAAQYRRAQVVLESFLEVAAAADAAKPAAAKAPDVLDPSIRSKETLTEVTASASPVSKRWGIVTELLPEDFAQALRTAHVDD
jgi:transcriptional regulator with XRE-family HTH domain